MLLAEFIRRTGFTPEFADTLSSNWQEVPDTEALPECFTDGFFERYAEKLAVPTPFAPELPELNARVAAEPALRVYANLIIDAAFRRDEPGLGKWPAPEKLLTRRQCGLFQLLMAMSALPLIAASYRQIGLPPEHADGPAKWIGGTIAIYAAAHDGNPGHDLQQIHWLKHYMENRLFRVGRFEFLVHSAPEWLPAIYRSRKSGRTVALCRDGWVLTQEGFRARNGAVGVAGGEGYPVRPEAAGILVAHLDEADGKVTGIPINPATGRAESEQRETLDLTEYAPVLSAHEWVPSLHIPGGGGMTPELAKESLRGAVEFFRRYFHKELHAICCESWILNPDWMEELPGSNLARFMEEVYLTPMPEVDRAGLFFVYGRSEGKLSEYPADNSLRRAFRRIIDAGRPLRMGGMFILTADLDRFGTGTYRNR